MIRFSAWAAVLAAVAAGCATSPRLENYDTSFSAAQSDLQTAGQAAIVLRQLAADGRKSSQPSIIEAVILPGTGMQLHDLKAFVPSKGELALLGSASASVLLGDSTLKSKMERVEMATGPDHAYVTGVGKMKPELLAAVTARLNPSSFLVTIIAKNDSDADQPLTLSWQPSFDREFKLRSASGAQAEWVSPSLGIRVRAQSPLSDKPKAKQVSTGGSESTVRFTVDAHSVKPGESLALSAEVQLFHP